ncbi:SpoIIE family protein phosphatase, partial [Streptomyces sp. PRKS01-29]
TRPAPPLGLASLGGELPSLQVVPFAEGDQMLLYTDGVIEARDHGREYFPLLDRVPRHICDEPSRTLASLHDELLSHVGGRLHDDAALLLLRKPVLGAVHRVADVPSA